MSNRGQLGHMPYDYKAARGAHDHAGQFFAFPRPSTLSFAMPLDVGAADVLEIVQRVCDRALNVATASAKSSTHGPKAGMSATYCISAVWVQVQVPSRTIHKVPLRSQQVQLDDDLMTTDDDCGSLGRPGGGRDLDPGGVRRSLVVPSQQFHCSALGSTQQHFQPARQ